MCFALCATVITGLDFLREFRESSIVDIHFVQVNIKCCMNCDLSWVNMEFRLGFRPQNSIE